MQLSGGVSRLGSSVGVCKTLDFPPLCRKIKVRKFCELQFEYHSLSKPSFFCVHFIDVFKFLEHFQFSFVLALYFASIGRKKYTVPSRGNVT